MNCNNYVNEKIACRKHTGNSGGWMGHVRSMQLLHSSTKRDKHINC